MTLALLPLVSSVLYAVGTAARPVGLFINTPISTSQCLPITLSYGGSNPPFVITFHPEEPSQPPLEIVQAPGTYTILTAQLEVGSYTVKIKDSTGASVMSEATLQVTPGDHSCLVARTPNNITRVKRSEPPNDLSGYLPSPEPNRKSRPIGPIIGGVLAGGLIFLSIPLTFFLWNRKRRLQALDPGTTIVLRSDPTAKNEGSKGTVISEVRTNSPHSHTPPVEHAPGHTSSNEAPPRTPTHLSPEHRA